MNIPNFTRVLFLSACLALLISGCDSMKDAWNWSRDYVDPDPEIELDTSALSDDPDERLAQLFAPMDSQIDELERLVEAQQDYPADSWVEMLFVRFPWINGVLTVQSDGEIINQRPEHPLKPLNLEPLLGHKEDWVDGMMRAEMDITDFGPEIYMANAFVKERDWLGLTVVHFDPRSLIKFCPKPEELIIITPEHVIWSGPSQEDAEALRDLSWDDILEDDVAGEDEVGGAEYMWISRFLGGVHLIYATPVGND